MLWHVAAGDMPGFLDETLTVAGWTSLSHRGVQILEKVKIPRKQRSYVYSPRWELRFDCEFEQVVRACADTSRGTIQKRCGRTWITEPLIRGLVALNRQGYAHSYETWENGNLVGGVWGFQLGGFISMNSMFHFVSNAGKAAFALAQLHLGKRGFEFVDMNGVPDHLVNFGMEWIPRWDYEARVERVMRQKNMSIADNIPVKPIPWQISAGLPWLRRMKGVVGRVRNLTSRPAPVAPTAVADPPGAAA